MKKMLIYAGMEIAMCLSIVICTEIKQRKLRRKVEKEYKERLVKCQQKAISQAERIMKIKRG